MATEREPDGVVLGKIGEPKRHNGGLLDKRKLTLGTGTSTYPSLVRSPVLEVSLRPLYWARIIPNCILVFALTATYQWSSQLSLKTLLFATDGDQHRKSRLIKTLRTRDCAVLCPTRCTCHMIPASQAQGPLWQRGCIVGYLHVVRRYIAGTGLIKR